MERTIFSFILAYTKREQIILMFVTLASFPFLYYSLDLPKIIINDAINGGDHIRDLFGFSFGQLPYLFLLCSIFLLMVLFNGGFKYFINVYRGRLAELMLRRIRYILYSRILRFPLPHFSKISQGEIVSIITAEVEPLGGFFGEAFSMPLYQGGFLLTILGFITLQNPYMGLAAIALYPLQMWLIPKLQRHVNQLAKQRVLNVRKMSQRIGETVGGVHEVHANDTSQYELAGISDLLGRNFNIRLNIYKRKFFIKFLNNFIGQITPFFFYSAGGYLVIQGDLSFGALVATLAAYKELATPWKELLGWYQRKEDTRIKYDQLVERFHPEGMMDEALQIGEPETISKLGGQKITTSNLGWEDEGGVKAVDGVGLDLNPGEKVLIVGGSGSGKEHLARILARLLSPSVGNIRIGEENMAALPETVTGRQIAYANSEAYMFSGTIAENLLYGLFHRPSGPANSDDEAALERENDLKNSILAGNSEYDPHADWTNYQVAGLSGPENLTERIVSVLGIVGLVDDVYSMGLKRRIDPSENPELCSSILSLRKNLAAKLKEPDTACFVEQFDENSYNENATVAENLLFGTSVGEEFAIANLAQNAYVREILDKNDLTNEFIEMGLQVAKTMVDLFQDLPSGHEYFERFGFINADDFPEYQLIISRAERDGIGKLSEEDSAKLTALPFHLTFTRHRLGIMHKERQAKILEVRRSFRENIPEELKGCIEFFDTEGYNAMATIQDNILFGRVSFSQQGAEEHIGTIIHDAVIESGLYRDIMITGLELPAGIGGRRLAPSQRQKISLARCLLKRPDLLILDEIFSALELTEKKQLIQSVISEIGDGTLVYIDSEDTLEEYFDRKLFMKQGRLSETVEGIKKAEKMEIDEGEGKIENLADEVRHLQQIPLLASFDVSALKLLAFTSKRLTFETGQELFHQGDHGDTAYIIIEGGGELFVSTSDGDTFLRDFGPNEILGEIALLSDVPRTATARVTERLAALELTKEQYFSLLEQDNQIVIEMLKQMSAHLEKATAMLAESKSLT